MYVGHRISTFDLPERERMAFWVEAVCEKYLELKVDSTAGRNFRGTIDTHQVGALTLNHLSFDDQHVQRTKQSISRSKRSEFYLIQSRDGPLCFEQLGRRLELAQGECTLLDSRHPYTIDNKINRDALTISLPTDWLLTWLPVPERALLNRWTPSSQWGGVLSSMLANITPLALSRMPIMPSVFCDQLGAQIALAASDIGHPSIRVHPSLLERLRDTLRARFQESALCPAQVARHNGVSTRYLHLQFVGQGTSFSAELVQIRLSHAMRMLSDSSYQEVPISEIALRCGFTNASHFARRFRFHFGHSPTAIREH